MSDLFNSDLNDGMSFLQERGKNNDGIYRPSVKLAKDKQKGYKAKIRFLKNFTVDGKVGENAPEKILHYVKLDSAQELNGYYDSMKNFPDEKCLLNDTFWKLYNSDNVVDKERAKSISRSIKYYSYIQIIEDENQPELVGKIMVLPFGIKIKEKIQQEYTGEISDPCNVYDLANGKDFILLVKEVGGFANYDSSQFVQQTSPMYIAKEVDGVTTMKQLPVTTNAEGVNSIDPKYHKTIQEYLLNRDVDLTSFEAKRWDDETRGRVEKIVAFLTNSPMVSANESINSVAKVDDGSFFEEDEDDTSIETTESAPSSSVADENFFDV